MGPIEIDQGQLRVLQAMALAIIAMAVALTLFDGGPLGPSLVQGVVIGGLTFIPVAVLAFAYWGITSSGRAVRD